MFVSRRSFEKLQDKYELLSERLTVIETELKLKEEQEKNRKGSYSILGVPDEQKKYIESQIAKTKEGK